MANLLLIHGLPGFDLVDFFSFFTNWSNLFAAAVFAYAAFHQPGPRLDSLRGAAVVWLATTGTVDLILLGRGAHLDPPLNAVHFDLHRVVPVAAAIDWAVNPPARRFGVRDAVSWLSIPILFAVYSMARGSLIHWYPYGFFDPGAVGGYAGVLWWVAGISVGVLAIAALVIVVGNLGHRMLVRRSLAPDPP